jgi:hypothetical protein
MGQPDALTRSPAKNAKYLQDLRGSQSAKHQSIHLANIART